MCNVSQMTKEPHFPLVLPWACLQNTLVSSSSAYEGEHDDDEGDHHEPQHPRVDVGGVGEHGDGDGGEDEEPQQHHPEHVAHAEAVGAVQTKHLPCHPLKQVKGLKLLLWLLRIIAFLHWHISWWMTRSGGLCVPDIADTEVRPTAGARSSSQLGLQRLGRGTLQDMTSCNGGRILQWNIIIIEIIKTIIHKIHL